jgi:hypothetical protein
MEAGSIPLNKFSPNTTLFAFLLTLLPSWRHILSYSAHTTPLSLASHFSLHSNASFNFLCTKHASRAVPSITGPVSAPFLSIRASHANRLIEFRIFAIESSPTRPSVISLYTVGHNIALFSPHPTFFALATAFAQFGRHVTRDGTRSHNVGHILALILL